MNDIEMIARIEERAGLAQIYAEDGAFHTAAKIFKELGDEVESYANRRMRGLIRKGMKDA